MPVASPYSPNMLLFLQWKCLNRIFLLPEHPEKVFHRVTRYQAHFPSIQGCLPVPNLELVSLAQHRSPLLP